MYDFILGFLCFPALALLIWGITDLSLSSIPKRTNDRNELVCWHYRRDKLVERRRSYGLPTVKQIELDRSIAECYENIYRLEQREGIRI